MAHTCPECGMTCHCGGDIDDICFGDPEHYCTCCEDDGWDDEDEEEDFYNSNPLNRLNIDGYD